MPEPGRTLPESGLSCQPTQGLVDVTAIEIGDFYGGNPGNEVLVLARQNPANDMPVLRDRERLQAAVADLAALQFNTLYPVVWNGGMAYYPSQVVQVSHPVGSRDDENARIFPFKVHRGKLPVLAELGSTGISRGPHVHFELMHNGKNCDPAPLFRPGVRHRNGKISPLKYVKWTKPTKIPAGIKCAPRRRHPRSRLVIHE